ncbi:uncharacterized protein LOC119323955 [Triticum dicoccoides]|uniref:uncharacterized protein LOC119323955 n=1 Tax=Triticum dicoccoides TaxID=85692 RepID=UPI001891A32D|nr:uncharacterized protein LOC119323955 [Triticum dicoccoides]XP_037453565.1 uncharacterized protein LOC119323955 [Triticum dicoccoides]
MAQQRRWSSVLLPPCDLILPPLRPDLQRRRRIRIVNCVFAIVQIRGLCDWRRWNHERSSGIFEEFKWHGLRTSNVIHDLKDFLKSANAYIHFVPEIERADSTPNLRSIVAALDGRRWSAGQRYIW